jgi:sugar phosphate permease
VDSASPVPSGTDCRLAVLAVAGRRGVVNVLISIYGFEVFHQGNRGVGVLYGALGAGFLVSGFFSQRAISWLGRFEVVFPYMLEGAGQILCSQAPTLWTAALCLAMATLGAGRGNAAVDSLVMQYTSKAVHGRVFALFNTLSNVVHAANMMLTGVTLDTTRLSPRTIGLVSGLYLLLAALSGFGLGGYRHPRQDISSRASASR